MAKRQHLKFAVGLGAIAIIGIAILTVLLNRQEDAIAEYKGGTIGAKEHHTYLKIMELYSPGIAVQLQDADFRKTAVLQHIALDVMAERGEHVVQNDVQSAALERWEAFRAGYAESFSSNGEGLRERLQALGLSEEEVVRFNVKQIYGDEYLKSTLDMETLKRDYRQNSDRHYFDRFDLDRILVSYTTADSKARTREEARTLASEIVLKLRAGSSFAELARAYSDLPLSPEDGGHAVDVSLYEIDSDIQEAIVKLPLHEISDPLEAEGGYYIVRIDRKSTLSYDEAIEVLKISYLQDLKLAFIKEELPGLQIRLSGN